MPGTPTETGLLRLAVLGSWSAYGRLAGIVVGVAVGVCLLLLLWGGVNGLQARDDRGAWLRESGSPAVSGSRRVRERSPRTVDAGQRSDANQVRRGLPGPTDRPARLRGVAAHHHGIPGTGRPPAPGNYYASPALQRLIESTPRDQLGDRFGKFAGTIDDAALPGPDSLIVVTGAQEAELRRGGTAAIVSEFTSNPYGGSAAGYATVLMIGALAVFFPVLLLISIVTGLGAAQRRERFATLRLIGASPRTVSRIAAVEVRFPA